MQEIEGGISIEHEGPDGIQEVQTLFDKNTFCLTFICDGKRVELTDNETGYFLAQMAGWYELGGD